MYSQNEKIVPVYIEEELKNAYLSYAMSVIVGRALPDVRDGLKPVHRRILFAMYQSGLFHDRQHQKSARVVGDVLGNYHPHGDSAVYDTIVRMVQNFSLRYPLIDGQGNFGSVDGDPPAAYRYTEVRMKEIAEEMMRDIEKNTVDWMPNFDDTKEEPAILPSAIPNLLVNGSSGIAVGMATNMAPHNLTEVIDGIIAVIDDSDIEIKDLFKHVKGPDFPTGGLICGRDGIRDAYLTGRGKIVIRAKANIEKQKGGKDFIVINEIPYQVNKAVLIENIANLVRDKKITGISNIRDESDRDGMRVVVELKRGEIPQIILNQLFKHTEMQTTFGIINLALVNNRPVVMNLKQLIQHYIKHRREIVIRRTKHELEKAEERAHILEGYKVALDNLDKVIKIIRQSKTREEAKNSLMDKFSLSEKQANAILDMRLHQLTGLEREKIEQEYLELIKLIEQLKSVLASEKKVMNVIKNELIDVRKKYGDERRTQIVGVVEEFEIEQLIAEEDMVITVSHTGYIKRLPVSTYRKQKRGGKGLYGMDTKEGDFVEYIFVATTHQYIMFFTTYGRCHWIKVYEIPLGGRLSKGKAIVNLLKLNQGEQIAAFIPAKQFDDEHFVLMATKLGMIKKTVLSAYGNPRAGGIIAVNLKKEDSLIAVVLTGGQDDIVLGTKDGFAIRFFEKDVRETGRSSQGVRGISLRKGDFVVGMVNVSRATSLLTVTENGYGKRTSIDEYRRIRRGGKGVINIQADKRNGFVVTIMEVQEGEEIILMSQGGMVIRMSVNDIRKIGRNTKGVRLIHVEESDKVIDVAKVVSGKSEEQASKESGIEISLEAGNGEEEGDEEIEEDTEAEEEEEPEEKEPGEKEKPDDKPEKENKKPKK